MTMSDLPWWREDDYILDEATPEALLDEAGPQGVAVVKAYPDGRTSAGWGEKDFMGNYNSKKFHPRRVMPGYVNGAWAFAFIMRSMRVVCLDIDGKNGGFDGARQLGMLPYTLAETSKSGNGYHLFFSVDDDWDDQLGYASLADRIGIAPGVDFRGTGCVYHYDTQRWNQRPLAPLPQHLKEVLVARKQKQAEGLAKIVSTLAGGDEEEILMMHDQLLADLDRPIEDGKRNNTLFAIGTRMKLAELEGWELHIAMRANELGIEDDELEKLLNNVKTYGTLDNLPKV